MGEVRGPEHSGSNPGLLTALAIFILLLVTGWLVTGLLYHKEYSNEKVFDWLISVFGTLCSFVLGLAAGFFHLSRQNAAAQRRRKDHLRKLLEVELVDIKNWSTENTMTYIQPLILEEAIKSGLFCSDLTKKMLKLSKEYHKHNDAVTLSAAGEPKTIELPAYLKDATDEVLKEL